MFLAGLVFSTVYSWTTKVEKYLKRKIIIIYSAAVKGDRVMINCNRNIVNNNN